MPKELFIKDTSFKNQSEIRIVITSKLAKPIETIIDDPLQLIGVVQQALRDELTGSPMNIQNIDIYIAPILGDLEKRFNII